MRKPKPFVPYPTTVECLPTSEAERRRLNRQVFDILARAADELEAKQIAEETPAAQRGG
jgi:hypothetical protein